MTTLLDEIEGPRRAYLWLTLIVTSVAITLGVVKVKNELAMTKADDRQAAALERIADAAERTNPPTVVSRPQNRTFKEGYVENGLVWLQGDWRSCTDDRLRFVPCREKRSSPKEAAVPIVFSKPYGDLPSGCAEPMTGNFPSGMSERPEKCPKYLPTLGGTTVEAQ